jgi:uncharacterized membrane protein
MNKLIGGIQIAVGLMLLALSGTCAFIIVSEYAAPSSGGSIWIWLIAGVTLLGLFAIWQGWRLIMSNGAPGQVHWAQPLSLIVSGLVVMIFLGLPGLIIVIVGAAYFAWRHYDQNER